MNITDNNGQPLNISEFEELSETLLRDKIAIAAMEAAMTRFTASSEDDLPDALKTVAWLAYKAADAMLKEREKNGNSI